MTTPAKPVRAATSRRSARARHGREAALMNTGVDPEVRARKPDGERVKVVFADGYELRVVIYRGSEPTHIQSVNNCLRRHGHIVGVERICGIYK